MEENKTTFSQIWTDRKHIKTRIRIIAAIALIISAAVFFPNMNMLSQRANYEFSSVSEMAPGQSGHNLIIDNGKKTVLLVDNNDTLLKRIDGGSKNASSSYACHVAEGADGSIYLADVT